MDSRTANYVLVAMNLQLSKFDSQSFIQRLSDGIDEFYQPDSVCDAVLTALRSQGLFDALQRSLSRQLSDSVRVRALRVQNSDVPTLMNAVRRLNDFLLDTAFESLRKSSWNATNIDVHSDLVNKLFLSTWATELPIDS